MDVYESQQAVKKRSTAEIPRPALVPADMNNGTATRRCQTREISSRYRSPTPSAPRRTPSPSVRPTGTSSSQKRALSAERKRPSTPPSPSTPVEDTSTALLLASRKLMANRLPEALWPSTMRSLSVSFQSDTFSLPISKREKPVSQALSDRTLRPSSNVVHKQIDTRKPTPERKRSPLKGNNSADQSENSRPVDTSNSRFLDQHRWPSRTGGKVSSNALSRGADLSNKNGRTTSLPLGSGAPSLRRLSLDGAAKPLQKSSSDLLSQISSDESGRGNFRFHSFDDNSLLKQKERTAVLSPSARSQSLLASGSRPASPNKASILSSSVSSGISPSRTKAVTSTSSRGPSPSRVRPSSPSRQTKTSTSVLSFITDIKGKKAATHIEDAHQLRLLYNRHFQWRYANALVDAVLHSQKVKAKKMLHNVWRSTSELWSLVIEKRIELQQLRLKFKLHSVLNDELSYLDEWASIERDHTSQLSLAIQDLQACTLRLPITGGARGDIETVKAAVCSAVDMMQAMGSSICSVLSQVEGTNSLVSELADVAAQERAVLDECEALLASTVALQVEEYSIRGHLMQLEQATRCKQLIAGI